MAWQWMSSGGMEMELLVSLAGPWGFVFVRLQQWCLSVALFQLIEPAVVSVVETSEWDYANE
jgi:hypothetical protein